MNIPKLILKRKDSEIFIKAQEIGIIESYFADSKNTFVMIKECIKGRIVKVRLSSLPKEVDLEYFKQYIPSKEQFRTLESQYGLSRTEFFKDYTLSQRKDKNVFIKAEKLGLIKYDESKQIF